MRALRLLFTISLTYFGAAATAAPPPVRVLSKAKAAQFVKQVARRESRFYKPGVGFDGDTGMTYDGHEVDHASGQLRGGARTFSASSKESLHLILLTKALEGDSTAQTLIAGKSKNARTTALAVLARKIATYEQFDRDYPGYGGFLPWYKVEGGKIAPTSDWENRVPGLDNGQLAWSLYHTANALADMGEPALAARYERHLQKMRDNVVRIFYDPAEKKLRAEARLDGGNHAKPSTNVYANNVKGYFLDDSYEGELLGHFADLMGNWSAHPEGKDEIWKAARRLPVQGHIGKETFTVSRGHWFSGHEDWGYLVLPFRDVPIADRVFKNSQRARTAWSAEHGWSGLMASTHKPVPGNELDGYVSALGIPGIAKMKTEAKPIFAPYASFPLALVDKPMFATWLSTMLKAPGMYGPYGIGESFAENGQHAPVLTWDGKALPMVAWMGGIGPDVGRLLKRDGLYDAFIARVEHDFVKFDGVAMHGEAAGLRAPTKQHGPN